MNLYEIQFRKCFEDASVGELKYYQVLAANNAMDAVARLGQIYHFDDYTLKIEDVVLVRSTER